MLLISSGFPQFRVTLLNIITDPTEDYFKTSEEHLKWIEEHRLKASKMLENYRQILIQSGFNKDKVLIKINIKTVYQSLNAHSRN